MKTIEIELAVVRLFGKREHVIVPNISWGFDGIHECDLFIVSKSGYATEVEIKTSISDLKNDAKKQHGHISDKIRELYFAIPESLHEKALPHIPEHAGVILVSSVQGALSAKIVRSAKVNFAKKLTIEQQFQIARLGTMRIWNLKSKLLTYQNNQ